MTRTMIDKLAVDVATLLDQTKVLSMRVRALSHDAEVADRDDDPIWQGGFAEQFEQSRAKLITLRDADRELYERMAKFQNDISQALAIQLTKPARPTRLASGTASSWLKWMLYRPRSRRP